MLKVETPALRSFSWPLLASRMYLKCNSWDQCLGPLSMDHGWAGTDIQLADHINGKLRVCTLASSVVK